ncbi:MAG: ABC transporter permease [Rhizobiales bacterium]|nr:ABC transporter permease [Hyphomicrobiales bacterium]
MTHSDSTSAGRAADGKTPLQHFVLALSRLWAWAFLALLIIFFVISVSVTSGGTVNFLTLRNSQNILVAITPVLLLGLGQTFVIIAAGIDLSVGWVMSLASVLSALAIRGAFNAGAPLFLSVIAGFVAAVGGAAIVGLFNGVIIAKLKVPAFIVTLGSGFIVRGVSLLLSENTTVIGLPPGLRDYGNNALLYYLHGEGGGFYFLTRPELPSARPSSAATPMRSAATWRRRAAPASRSTATSSCSSSSARRRPASPGSCRRSASTPARR